ncbi:MAG: Nif3-like dinuclear metal center hexameric protein [Chlorobi bacterium]|nr:Nif3-like dinuclear metal center hexameric protein [Chlorobiota bacterium]
MTAVRDIAAFLDEQFPPAYAEDFDNTGLLVGDPSAEVTGILVTHDTTLRVLDEAREAGANLIVSFHPLIFRGLKSLTGKTYVERVVMEALRRGMAVYSPHTAVDKHPRGVSYWTARALGLEEIRILMPEKGHIYQLVTYVPHAKAEQVRTALFRAGAGHIGEYEECSYNLEGYGTFKPSDAANPYVGEKGVRHREPETRVSVIFPRHLEHKVVRAMIEAHPYEEPAYEVFATRNIHEEIGLGVIGRLPDAMDEEAFLRLVKEKLHVPVVRHSELRGKPVRIVALVGGSGAFGIDAAKNAGADAFVSGDFKYHDFFKAEGQILLVDAGHYESEQFTAAKLAEIISEKFPNFAVAIAQPTNPVKYF